MRLNIIAAIYRKEVLDLVRDRRTLISMIVVPMLVFPLMMIAGASIVGLIADKSRSDAKSKTVAAHAASAEVMDALRRTGLNIRESAQPRAGVENKSAIAAVEEVEGVINVYVDSSDASSAGMGDRLQIALTELKEDNIRRSLRASGIPESVLTPFTVRRVNIATQRKMAGAVWGSMLGYILLLLMFTGGMYPIIDMTAGEKERKTLETFLASAAGRDEIVLGKMLAAITAIALTAALTLASVVFSVRNNRFASKSEEMRAMLSTIPLDFHTVSLIALTLVPLIVFAAAVMIAIAMFARSFKEGQSYLTPLVLFVIFPALLGGLPGLEMTPLLALIPIFNASQIIRSILLGEFPVTIFAVTFAANLTYAALAFFIAKRRFEDESVLFRS